LRVAQIDGEVAAGGSAGGVEVAEGQFGGFGRGLAEAAGGAGQRHHHADGMGAGRLLGLDNARRDRCRRGCGQEKNVTHGTSFSAEHLGGSSNL
jgi:hypothetical protein